MAYSTGDDNRKRILDLVELFERGQVSARMLQLGLRNHTAGLGDELVGRLQDWDRDVRAVLEYVAEADQDFELRKITRAIRKALYVPE